MSQILPEPFGGAPCCGGPFPLTPTAPCGNPQTPCSPVPCEGTIPGPQGAPGAPGAPGLGINAYTLLVASFTVPAAMANVTIVVGNTAWMAVGAPVFIGSAGVYQVAGIVDANDVTLTNLGYATNAAPATSIASGQPITPTGFQGPTGASGSGVSSVGLSVPSYFQVTGSPVTSTGTLAVTATPAQTANSFLATPSGSTGALTLRTIVFADLPVIPLGAPANFSGALTATNGGTGQTSAAAGFNALSPTTTAGDIIYNTGAGNGRLAIGTPGAVLTVSGGNPSWITPTTPLFSPRRQVTMSPDTMLASDLVIGVKVSATVSETLLAAPANGRLVTIKDESGAAATNHITVLAGSGDTIEGSASTSITTNYGYRQLYYDAADKIWFVIASA